LIVRAEWGWHRHRFIEIFLGRCRGQRGKLGTALGAIRRALTVATEFTPQLQGNYRAVREDARNDIGRSMTGHSAFKGFFSPDVLNAALLCSFLRSPCLNASTRVSATLLKSTRCTPQGGDLLFVGNFVSHGLKAKTPSS